jgi:hypothetical protein
MRKPTRYIVALASFISGVCAIGMLIDGDFRMAAIGGVASIWFLLYGNWFEKWD